jgi:riboflavin synthase
VNLERALRADDRNSGHTVSGHIDGTGRIVSIRPDGNSVRVLISTVGVADRSLIVPKGFIAIDGASLTVCEVGTDWFTLMLIPHTREVLRPWDEGGYVNIEIDCLGKYVAGAVDRRIAQTQRRMETLVRVSIGMSLASLVLGVLLNKK